MFDFAEPLEFKFFPLQICEVTFLYLCRIPYDITFSHTRYTYDVLTAVLLTVRVFCDVTLCLWVIGSWQSHMTCIVWPWRLRHHNPWGGCKHSETVSHPRRLELSYLDVSFKSILLRGNYFAVSFGKKWHIYFINQIQMTVHNSHKIMAEWMYCIS
jgi:hypothetical protein